MRIYTPSGDLKFTTLTFPDGQPHFKLETHDPEPISVTIEMAIKTPADLFMVGLVSDVLRASGYTSINLDVRYLLAARMDRAIDNNQPFTLRLVSRVINGCGFNRVRILDVHSDVSGLLIHNSENVLPFDVVQQVRKTLDYPWILCPDNGAQNRVSALCGGFHLRGVKHRDMQTGTLTGFGLDCCGVDKEEVESVLIVDDICDGGGTFVGLAKVLRAAGAEKVYLYVTHGIFSKGLPLHGIDHVYTTDSYLENEWTPVEKGPVGAGDESDWNNARATFTIVPVSMKEM